MPRKRPRPEDDAALWFIAVLGLSLEEETEIRARSLRQAKEIAVHTEATAVRSVWLEVLAQEAGSVPLEEGKAAIVAAISKAFQGGDAPWRLSLMAGLATQVSYQRGRWEELQAQAKRKTAPMLRYTSALEARTCSYCRSLHGTTLPAGDAWWQSHYPPQHGACLCTVLPAPAVAASTQSPTPETPDPGFGVPAQEYVMPLNEMPAEIAAVARKKVG